MSSKLYPDYPVLIVDDEAHIVESQLNVLRSNGINNIISTTDSREVLGLLHRNEVEVVILDLRMPYISGEDILLQIRDDFPHVPVIIITGTNEIDIAVKCMRAGAFDYMVKAVEESRLVSGISRAIELRELKREYWDLRKRLLSDRLSNPEVFSGIITQNRKMQSIFLFVESIAKTDETVLISGETGVGKELIAGTIHDLSRPEMPFVAVNVAGLDDTMFSDSLFGHRKGAYTGAADSRKGFLQQASGGTILLDEIGDLSPSSQVKLIRLLETGEYYPLGSDLIMKTDARIVVSTNKNLNEAVGSGEFRKDLYYRLSAHEIKIPLLRERKKDLPLLVRHFMEEASKKLSKEKLAVPPELIPLLEIYDFPGNIRELRSMIFDAVSKQTEKMLSLKPFKEAMGKDMQVLSKEQTEELIIFKDRLPTIAQASDSLVAEAMKRAKGVRSTAAMLLGISPQALGKRLNRKGRIK
ncbi:MAG: sigma-54-dependent Fis family transcriptional regulator [Spirochaetes bacterium]|nr:sigma-54-dependent Fis family transcriptional regulator [Spirochaetota bacterium]